MAQYQRNFYASTLYGRIKAAYGEYTTEIFDGQEPFSSQINTTIFAQLPNTTYVATQPEFTPSANWIKRGTDLVTTIANSSVEFLATGDNMEIHVRLQNQGTQSIQAKLYKEELVASTYQWVEKQTQSLSTLSITAPGTIGKILFSSYGYGDYKVVITAMNSTAEAILVAGHLRTGDITLSVRTSANKSTWSNWEKISLTKTLQGTNYLVTGTGSTSYNNIQYVQGKLEIYSSDNLSSPIIDRVELRSNDSGLYDYNGEYILYLDMNTIAATQGSTFKKINFITWTEPSQPQGTQMFIRTSSSSNNTFWGPVSAPYSKSPHRLRLKEGANSHSIILGPINEGTKFDFSKTIQMLSWDTQAYGPKDRGETTISYYFSKTKENPTHPDNKLNIIEDFYSNQNKTLSFTPQPYFLTVKMTRSNTKGTPVVDWINIDQTIRYLEDPNIEGKDISAIDTNGTGVVSLQKIRDYSFSYPQTTNQSIFNTKNINEAPLTYNLNDNTNRPTDVILYFQSESTTSSKTNISTSADDEIIAKVYHRRLEFGEETGIITHYQTARGEVQYLRPYNREMEADFTPSLLDTKRYRYYLLNGWPDDIHVVIDGQTLKDVADMYKTTEAAVTALNPDILTNEDGTLVKNQQLKIPNTSINPKVTLLFENGTVYTMKSGHNADYDKANGITVVDSSSENISISVTTIPEKGYEPWTSEVKIYTGVINFNDHRDDFLRTQYNQSTHSSLSRKYTVSAGDTWESIASMFDLAQKDDKPNVIDLKFANTDIETLEEGQILTIPPNIVLPDLEAEVEVDNPSMPFEISIIPDSVQLKNGTRLDESFIPINWNGKHLPMEVAYRESPILTATLTRGDEPNGKDPLPLNNVLRIESVSNLSGSVHYHEWNGGFGDFKLTSNYIDWSPSLAGSIEPATHTQYLVTYVRNEIDYVNIHLDTTFFEQMGTDLVWRSPEIKIYDGICTPTQDFEMKLPSPNDFQGYRTLYQNIGYVIEDNDLWVETKIEQREDGAYLIGTLNGKDPSKNWYPTIQTGYYYLNQQEYYLYSQIIKTILNETALPTIEGIEYVNGVNGIGVLLLPSGENFIKDSVYESVDWKTAKKFTIDSVPA